MMLISGRNLRLLLWKGSLRLECSIDYTGSRAIMLTLHASCLNTLLTFLPSRSCSSPSKYSRLIDRPLLVSSRLLLGGRGASGRGKDKRRLGEPNRRHHIIGRCSIHHHSDPPQPALLTPLEINHRLRIRRKPPCYPSALTARKVRLGSCKQDHPPAHSSREGARSARV